MSGHEVDAGVRPFSAAFVQITAAGNPVTQLGNLSSVALHVAADGIAVLVVPFGPAQGKVADLVTAGSQVPRLSDQFHAGQNGVLINDVEEGAQAVHIVQFPREGGGQIETKPIYV